MFSLPSTALLANLSDRYGRRPVYLASISLFALGSLVIALAPTFWLIVVGRAIQGIGAGGIIPTASAVIGDEFPVETRGRALGLIGATYGMAFVLGPPFAGVVMVVASWHWIFLANLPIAAVVLWLGLRVLPRHRSATAHPPLDVAGIVAVFLFLAALVLAVTRGTQPVAGVTPWPWLVGAMVVLLGVVIAIERRAASPMIPLSLFGNRRLATAYLLTVGAGFGMGSVVFLTSIATLAYGVEPKHAGFVLLPLVLCSMLGSVGGGRVLHRVGARWLIVLGFVMLGAGYGAAAVTTFGLAGFLVASVPIGIGVGILVGGALRSIALDEAPSAVRGAAQGLVNICTSVGTLLSAAAIGALADLRGGGADGFATAYVAVAVLMGVMLVVALGLRDDRAEPIDATVLR